MSTTATTTAAAPIPLFRGLISLNGSSPTGTTSSAAAGGVSPSSSSSSVQQVHLTTWGTPLEEAEYVAFYFGGMPTSGEEPAIHSLAAGEVDVYKGRKIHLLCIDKPGMGLSPFSYQFSIRRDWPEIVNGVAQMYGIDKYGIFGMSNGGPYVMSCLIHPTTKDHIIAATMIVGVSDDVWSSGYFSFNHWSGIMEGLYNSFPIVLTGPLNYILFSMGSYYFFQWGGYETYFADLPSMIGPNSQESKSILQKVMSDGLKTFGLGSAIDSQQGLSPLYSNSRGRWWRKKDDLLADYATITCPVSSEFLYPLTLYVPL